MTLPLIGSQNPINNHVMRLRKMTTKPQPPQNNPGVHLNSIVLDEAGHSETEPINGPTPNSPGAVLY